MEKMRCRMCIFIREDRKSMLIKFISCFSKFVSFFITFDIGVGTDFVYGKRISFVL